MLCDSPKAQPILTTIYYISFVVIGAFGILSSMVGIIGDSMEESIATSHKMRKDAKEEEFEIFADKKIDYLILSGDVLPRRTLEALDTLRRALRGKMIKSSVNLQKLNDPFLERAIPGTLFYNYLLLSHVMSVAARAAIYEHIVSLTIILVAIAAGLETSSVASESTTELLNSFVQGIFTADVAIKCVAEPYPWFYFNDDWNKFDVIVVTISYVPLSGNGGLALMLRLLRLLRLLKIMRRFKTLQIILETLSMSLRSIVLISGLLFILMTIIGGFGVLLFGKNDPAHFGDIRLAFVCLFQILTLDSWSIPMYINLFGCSSRGSQFYIDSSFQNLCTAENDSPQFVAAALYFPAAVGVLTWVMVTMFIGLMTTGMEESLAKNSHLASVRRKVLRIKSRRKIRKHYIRQLKRTFEFLDFFERGVIGPIEFYFALEHSGMPIDAEQFEVLWNCAKKSDPENKHIDFSEFLTLILDTREVCIQERSARLRLKTNVNSSKQAQVSFSSSSRLPTRSSVRKSKNELEEGHNQMNAAYPDSVKFSQEGVTSPGNKQEYIFDEASTQAMSSYYFSSKRDRYANNPFV